MSQWGSALTTSPARSFRALVSLQHGGDRLPFFCVCGAGGNVLNFRSLSSGMHREQPFYGLQAYGIDGVVPPHGSIEEMARAYLEEVRDVQPRGPYLLGGYSGGGIVAFEMAQTLTAAGEQVDLLALIDTFHPQLVLRQRTLWTRLGRLRREGIDYVVGVLRARRERARITRDFTIIDGHLARGEPVPLALRSLHLTRNFRRAARLYQPKPWPGRATLFRASDVQDVFQDVSPANGWERHVLGGVETVVVPGAHLTVLIGANAQALAPLLRAAIERAQLEAAAKAQVSLAKTRSND